MYGLSEAQLRKLQRVQNTAARIITRSSKFDNITPLLRQLHWLPLEARFLYKILLLTFMTLHGLNPSYLRQLLKDHHSDRAVRLSILQCLLLHALEQKLAKKVFPGLPHICGIISRHQFVTSSPKKFSKIL
ncbi:hypothetical protein HOLleu_06347 [Holothuria leucospilota]|uniref:Uncharacterized protein n=1 Tax=Holothuria leucospilota TaxID=206669 RepID=A0A9Q1CMQ3_HOLLE|nr:hypothetical protein HOLleu_06347 [Holothuria leucospilota]